MDAADPRPRLRALLHDQGEGEGHGARPGHRLRHREAERRLHLAWTASRDRARPSTSTCPRSEARGGRKDAGRPAGASAARARRPCCSSRTRRMRPRARAGGAGGAAATGCCEAAGGRGGAAHGRGPPGDDRPAADRRGDAGHERARAGRAARPLASRDEGALHLGLHRRRRLPARRAARGDSAFIQKPFTTDALERKVREILDSEARPAGGSDPTGRPRRRGSASPPFARSGRISSFSTPRGHMCAHIPQPTQAARLNDWLAIAYCRTSMPISQ